MLCEFYSECLQVIFTTRIIHNEQNIITVLHVEPLHFEKCILSQGLKVKMFFSLSFLRIYCEIYWIAISFVSIFLAECTLVWCHHCTQVITLRVEYCKLRSRIYRKFSSKSTPFSQEKYQWEIMTMFVSTLPFFEPVVTLR